MNNMQDQHNDIETSSVMKSQFAVPSDKKSLLAKTMQARLNSSDMAKRKERQGASDVLEDTDHGQGSVIDLGADDYIWFFIK
jgi:hypothetical protein